MMCSISAAKGVSLPEEQLTGRLNVRNTFIDSEDAESLQERFSNMRRVSSCPALYAHKVDETDTAERLLAEPRGQDSPAHKAETTDPSRTRLSSGAKMFQPRPAATSTTFYATPARPCLQ
ncbi:fadA, partial [Symbiodinium sp. KB8]